MSVNGRYLVSCSADKTVSIWNMLRNTQEAVLTGHTGWVYSLCMSRDERFIVSEDLKCNEQDSRSCLYWT
jgi:WD40 repeat protein